MRTELPECRRRRWAGKHRALSLALLLALHWAAGSAQAERTESIAGPKLDAHDRAVVEALPASDREALDRKLRLGLTLYYDGNYRLAQPVLQEVANRAATMDVLFWLGRCALLGGDNDTAIRSFSAMLERYPGLATVRLELADAYGRKGDTAQAQAQRALAGQSSYVTDTATLAAYDAAPAARMRAGNKRFGALFRGTLGTMYDNNVSVQPDVDKVTLPGGGTITGTRALSDWATVANLNLETVHDLTGEGKWYWHNTAGLYAQFYHKDRQFDYDQTDLRTGLDWISDRTRVRLPIGFIHRDYGNEQLSNSWYAEPTFERDLSDRWSLISSFRFEAERFTSELRAAQDDKTSTLSIGPAWHRDGAALSQIVALKAQAARSVASIDAFTYRDAGFVPSWLGRFKSGLEILVEGRYLHRQFDGPPALFTDNRTDKRYMLTTIATYPLGKRYVVGAWYAYTKNDSNIPLFAFSKSVVGLNVGLNLDK